MRGDEGGHRRVFVSSLVKQAVRCSVFRASCHSWFLICKCRRVIAACSVTHATNRPLQLRVPETSNVPSNHHTVHNSQHGPQAPGTIERYARISGILLAKRAAFLSHAQAFLVCAPRLRDGTSMSHDDFCFPVRKSVVAPVTVIFRLILGGREISQWCFPPGPRVVAFIAHITNLR